MDVKGEKQGILIDNQKISMPGNFKNKKQKQGIQKAEFNSQCLRS